MLNNPLLEMAMTQLDEAKKRPNKVRWDVSGRQNSVILHAKGISLANSVTKKGIVKLSEFDQKFGKARIHNSLIVQHSCSWPEVENRLNST